MHRPELRDSWDVSVWLEVTFEVSMPRGAQRGLGSPDLYAPENRRYLEGQRLYLRESKPQQHATLIINNEDLNAPYLVKRTSNEQRAMSKGFSLCSLLTPHC